MKKEIRELVLEGKKYQTEVEVVENEDLETIINIYNKWDEISTILTEYGCRRLNFPEISELIFCFIYGCWRVNNTSKIKHSSFDCYNPKNMKRIQIKATSSKNDTTSFGPRSIWDELYFMDFYSNGKYDGSFDIYKIPSDPLYNCIVNKKKNEKFVDQQEQGRRPRLCIKTKIIKPLKLKPIKQFNLFEL